MKTSENLKLKPGLQIYQSNINTRLQETKNLNLPFDISNELNQYNKVYITKEDDRFRNFHYFDLWWYDYKIYGELPDGDKKVLFTVKKNFECCRHFTQCIFPFVFCDLVHRDKIIYQLDYTRNGTPFYTQGFNVKKGLYYCKCLYCTNLFYGCCCPLRLNLRENLEPDNPNFDFGIKRGMTTGISDCFSCCKDKVVTYINEDGSRGQSLRFHCSDSCLFTICPWFIKELEIYIENSKGETIGIVNVANGCLSKRAPGLCMCPKNYIDLTFPVGLSSTEKFKLIATFVHFDLENGILQN